MLPDPGIWSSANCVNAASNPPQVRCGGCLRTRRY
jgi:hypothetical protein